MTNTPQQKTVVVGVEGPAGCRAAIRLAAEEANYRGAELIAVMAYSGERALGAPARAVATLRTADDERIVAEASLRDAVFDALGDQADKVQLSAVLGLAGRKLVETAQRVNAQLLVLAGRGSASMLLGTVSQYVLRKAPCPVLVVPEASRETLPEGCRSGPGFDGAPGAAEPAAGGTERQGNLQRPAIKRGRIRANPADAGGDRSSRARRGSREQLWQRSGREGDGGRSRVAWHQLSAWGHL